MNDLVLIPCPDLSTYPEQPKDQSKCEAVLCKKCGNKMWLSEKKKTVINLSEAMGKELFVAYYPCILEAAHEGICINHDIKKVEI